MKKKRTPTFVWLPPNIKRRAKKVSAALGISLSEYIRRLVLNDLEKRGLGVKNDEQDCN